MSLDVLQLLLLFVAGIFGGILNSIAGGGSFITFPTLIFVGVPPIIANATNTFAACAGYISGTLAFRREIVKSKANLVNIVLLSILGGFSGSLLLIYTSEQQFLYAVPWLLLIATLLFIFGGKANRALQTLSTNNTHHGGFIALFLGLFLFSVGVFGGFFNAGLGVIGLSYLAIAGYRDINLMNGLKLLISTCASAMAIVIFIFSDLIDWYSGIAVMLGTLTGGYFAAHFSQQVPQIIVRRFVTFSSISITLYFFYSTYL
ncbi:sulfite exporter TauE/SafE family protein [Vibrio nomapromontoriensis]|uniref:sulfite exporter TauE/SafE family protein n=1 Tax=Vibrio nomapromontoriensis TaxID=2910246 RepID=UPI003D0D6265